MFKRKRSRNILYDDTRRELKQKLLIYGGITIFVLLLGSGLIYYFTIFKPSNFVLSKGIDDRFKRLTIKTIEDFEYPTYNHLLYKRETNSLGYFFKQDLLTFNDLSPDVKILSTINEMYKCLDKVSAIDVCGISTANNQNSSYMASKKTVLKYAKLLYGPSISYVDKESRIQYGNITNLELVGDFYYFDIVIPVIPNSGIKEYKSIILDIDNRDKEIVITKAIVYVEELRSQGKTINYNFYNLDNKEKTLHTEKDNVSPEKLDDYLKNVFENYEVLKFNFFYTKQEDGSLTFKQVKKV